MPSGDDSPGPDLLFAYGTLLPGLVPPAATELVRQLVAVSPATTSGLLYDLGDFPAAVAAGDDAPLIRGWVYRLPGDSELLDRLDVYEGYVPTCETRSLFLRCRTRALTATGITVVCWIYLFHGDVADRPTIPGGDYRRYLHRAGTISPSGARE